MVHEPEFLHLGLNRCPKAVRPGTSRCLLELNAFDRNLQSAHRICSS